jgi:hypothetical protein
MHLLEGSDVQGIADDGVQAGGEFSEPPSQRIAKRIRTVGSRPTLERASRPPVEPDTDSIQNPVIINDRDPMVAANQLEA